MIDSNEISIEQINKLDSATFRLFYKNYYKALVYYAIQIIGEPDTAEDIVQELFSIIWEKKMLFRSLPSFKTYLYNSVRNASLDHLRHKDVESSYVQKVVNLDMIHRVGEDEEKEFFSEEIYRQLFQTISELPEYCRKIFLMYMKGRKNEEIAKTLNISLETVKTQKKRALAFLRGKLSHSQLMLLQVLLS